MRYFRVTLNHGRWLICVAALLVFSVVTRSLSAENLYLRPGLVTGDNDGSDWINAWRDFGDVVWDADQGGEAGELGPGDTLWVAGGTTGDATNNTTLIIGADGTPGNPITIKRALASESACTSATGWTAGFDSQLIIDKTQARIGTYVHYAHSTTVAGGRHKYSGIVIGSYADSVSEMPANIYGSHLVIDGSEPSGILIKFDGMGRDQTGSCVWDKTGGEATDKPCRDGPIVAAFPSTNGATAMLSTITLKNIEVEGPARGAKYLTGSVPREPVTQAAIQFDRKGGDSGAVVDGLTIQNCEFWGLVSAVRFVTIENLIFERNDCHTLGNTQPDGGGAVAPYNYSVNGGSYDAPHSSVMSNRGVDVGEIRYNYFHHYTAPSGVSFYNGLNRNVNVHGNVLYNPPEYTNGARGLGLVSPNNPPGPIYFYNNTLVGLNYAFTTASSVTNTGVYFFKNNILIDADQWTTVTVGDGEVEHDYNYFDQDYGGTNDDEANRVLGSDESMFVGEPLSTSSTFDDFQLKAPSPSSALDVGVSFNTDPSSLTRGSDGTWDFGAHEFNDSADTTPPTATWSIPSAGTTIVGAASEPVSEGTGGDGGFTISATGGAVTASNVVATASTITITTSRTLDQDETVTLTYVQPGDGIEDGAGNDMASFSSVAVANNSTQGSAPTIPSLDYSGFDVRDMLLEGSYTDNGTTVTIDSPASSFRARANITPPSNGDYTFSITFTAPAYSSDTFLLEIDGTPTDPADIVDLGPYVGAGETTIDAPHRGTGAWNDPEFNPQTWTLTTSAATVTIIGREAGVVLRSANIALVAGSDTTAPTPDPATAPTTQDEGVTHFTINAVVGSDPSGVEYQFEVRDAGGTSGNVFQSGWVSDPTYVKTDALGGQLYEARYRMRDSVPNVGDWSSWVEVRTEAGPDSRPVSSGVLLLGLGQ